MSVPWPDALVVREGQPITRLTEIPPGGDQVRSVPETAVLQEQAPVDVLRELQPITRLIELGSLPPPSATGSSSPTEPLAWNGAILFWGGDVVMIGVTYP